MPLHRVALWVLLALSASSASGQVYKWVDQNGKTHYGDRRQAEAAAVSTIRIPAPPPAPAEAARPSMAAKSRPSEPAASSAAPRVAAAPPPRTPCERAREMVKAIEEKRAYRAYGTGAKQDRVYLDESERKLFENDVREHCL